MRRLLYWFFLIAAIAIPSVYANHINWGTSGQRLYAADGETPLPGNRERNETTTGFIQLLWLGPNGVYDGLASTGDGTQGDDQVIAQSWVGDGNLTSLSDMPGQFDATDNPPSAPYASGVDNFAIRVFDTAVSDADWAAGNIPANGNYNYAVFANPVKVADFYNLWIDARLTVDIPLSWTLSILAAEGHGATDPAVGEYPYDPGEDAQASANPATGWELSQWLVDGENAGGDNPITVPASGLGQTRTLQAIFVRKQYTLTYTAGANGTIDGEPEGVQTVLHGDDGEPVTAIPAEGYRFDQWSDDVTTSTRTETHVVNHVNVTARFTSKFMPIITWPAPEAIVYGTALDGTQLNADADTDGTFVYDPPAGTVLSVGTHTLHATFTPDDGVSWPATEATVELTVVAGAAMRLQVDPGDGTPPITLGFGETETAEEDFDAWDAVAAPGVAASLFCRFVSDPDKRQLTRDFRPIPADPAAVTRWRLEVGAPNPPQGRSVHLEGDTRDGNMLTLTWDVGTAVAGRVVWLQRLDALERPVGFPVDMKTRDEPLGVPPGAVFEIVYGALREFEIPLARGWNAVGTPLLTRQAFGELSTERSGGSPAWRWNGEHLVQVEPGDPFPPKTGYMIRCTAESATLRIVGLPPNSVLPVLPGWALFSPVEESPPAGERSESSRSWEWSVRGQTYREQTSMLPGKAYWRHAGQAEPAD